MERHDTEPEMPAIRVHRLRQRFPTPWGLFIALSVYAVAVVTYVWVSTYRSPEYQAAEHYERAQELLGLDDGRSATRPQLEEAYGHLLEAARLMPRLKELHQRTEAMRWRFEERGWRLDADLTYRAEAVALLWRQAEDAAAPILVVGARDRGWAPEQLMAKPQRIFGLSLVGALAICLVWAYLKWSGHRVRAADHELSIRELQAELEAAEHAKRPPRT